MWLLKNKSDMLHDISLLILRNSFASFVQPDPSKQRSENLHIYKAQPTSRVVLGVTETEITLLVTEGSTRR